jgi:hypothetical protein
MVLQGHPLAVFTCVTTTHSIQNGSSSFAFAASSVIFSSQASWISEGFPLWTASRSGTIGTDLLDFFLSFKAPVCARDLPSQTRGRARSNGSSSHGIHSQRCPSVDTSSRVHSRVALLRPFGLPLQHGRLVPPSWSLTTSTVYSAIGLSVYCT